MLRALSCTAMSVGLSVPSLAAEPAAEFAVSPSQMKALGVTVQKLDTPGVAPGLAAPARAVLPPHLDIMVSAPVDGIVDQLMVSPQEFVKTGQPLLRLVSPSYGDLQLKLMESASKARLTNQTLNREKALFAEGIIPERRVQEAQMAASTATAAIRQAEAAMRLAGAESAVIRRVASGGRPDDALVVRAKREGLVATVDAKPGQRVKEADPLARIADMREMWLEIQLPASAVVARGSEFTAVGRDVAAVAQSTGGLIGESQTMTVRARVTKGMDKLRPGEALQVNAPLPAATGWTLPLQAVTRQGDAAYVFLRSARGFVATPVNVVSSAGQSVRVQGGLKSGQEVAVSSVIALKAAWLGKGGGE